LNLACVTPLPPVRSGVADYSATLLPYLRRFFERVIAVVDGYTPALPPGAVDEVIDVSDGAGWWSDGRIVPLYHMGSHVAYHRYVYQALRRFPGVTVLHDGNLLPFVHELTLGRGDRAGLVREAGFERGVEGQAAAWDALRQAVPLLVEDYPMLARVAHASLGVIVHSDCLRKRVLAACPQARVRLIPQLNLMAGDACALSRAELKSALGFDPQGLLIGAFGFIAPPKRLDLALQAFARLRRTFPRARFVCVGEVVPGYDLEGLLEELDLNDAVRVTGYVPLDQFERYLRAVDVGVSLRWPTWGEVSGASVRLMACGVPTLVSDAGSFAELPDEAVVKLPVGSGVATVEAALEELLVDAERRAAIGSAARAFIARHCEPRRVAEQYAAFIHAVVEWEG